MYPMAFVTMCLLIFRNNLRRHSIYISIIILQLEKTNLLLWNVIDIRSPVTANKGNMQVC